MFVLKITLVLLTSVCFLLSVISYESIPITKKECKSLPEKIQLLRDIDRGFVGELFSSEESISSCSSETTVESCLKQAYEEVHYNYVFSSLVYMHLTKMYVTHPEKLKNLTEKDLATIEFTEEAACILAILYNDSHENWKRLKEAMWVFNVYAERVAEFFKSYRDNCVDHFDTMIILYAHNAVQAVLEEFIETSGSLATGKFSTKIQELLTQSKKQNLTLHSNKARFRKQILHNDRLGLSATGANRFDVDRLRLNRKSDGFVLGNDIRDGFGTRHAWKYTMDSLEDQYLWSTSSRICLFRRIDALLRFHSEFVLLVKATIMYVVLRHLIVLKKMLAATTSWAFIKYTLWCCGSYNREIADTLTELADYFDLPDDRHLSPVIESINNQLLLFGSPFLIDCQFKYVRFMMYKMSEGRCSFSDVNKLLTDGYHNEYNGMSMINAAKGIVAKYGLNIPDQVVDRPVQEVILTAKILVEYVKKITENVDFKIINSLANIKSSTAYELLKKLEIYQRTYQWHSPQLV